MEDFVVGALSAPEAATLREHLATCSSCQQSLNDSSDDPELRRMAAAKDGQPAPIAEEGLRRLLDRLRETDPVPDYIEAPSATHNEPAELLSFLGSPERPGDLGTLGHLNILCELGRGGMGIVLLAYDKTLRRNVAVKVLRPDRGDSTSRSRFVQEARAAAGIESDHVAQVYSVVNAPGLPPYLVMQYVEGPTLREHIKSRKRLDPREAARLVMQVAQGLAAAHRAGLVHRDVKPGNVLIDSAAERARLMDFGLVQVLSRAEQLTIDGALAGTPEYMSPEQVRGQPLDARTDIYSLGVTLYEALTGEAPFRGVTTMVLQQVLNEEPLPPRRLNHLIPRDLQTVCLKAMAKEPARRYQTAAELADDLKRFLDDEPIHARPVTEFEHLWRWCRRHPREAILAALLFVVLSGGWIWTDHLRTREKQARAAADTQERNQRRERILADVQLISQTPREHGWFDKAWELLNEAALLGDDDTRTQEAAISILGGVDSRLSPLQDCEQFDASSIAFDKTGQRLALGGVAPNKRRFPQGVPAKILHLDADTQHASQLTHEGPVAFQPDGKAVLLSAFQDGSLTLWDIEQGKQLATFALPKWNQKKEGEAPPPLVALAPSGTSVAAAGPAGGAVWQAAGQMRFEFDEHATALAFSPDEPPTLLAVAHQGHVDLWSLKQGRRISRLSGPQWLTVCCLAFSPDARLTHRDSPHFQGRLAGGDSASVRVWDLFAQGSPIVCREAPGMLRGLAFSPDGSFLAAAGSGGPAIFDPGTGQRLLRHQWSYLTGVAFSPDGSRMAASAQGQFGRHPAGVQFFQPDYHRGVQVLHGLANNIERIAISADSRCVAALSQDWRVGVWDVARNRRLAVFTLGPPYNAYLDNAGIALDRDGRRVACAAYRQMIVWDSNTGAIIQHHSDLAPSLNNVVAFDSSGTLFSLRVETLSGTQPPYGPSYDWRKDPRVCRVYDHSGPQARFVHEIKDFNQYVFPIRAASDGSVVILEGLQDNQRRFFKAFQLPTGQALWEKESGHAINTDGGTMGSMDPTGQRLALSLQPGKGITIDCRTGEVDRGLSDILAGNEVLGPGVKLWSESVTSEDQTARGKLRLIRGDSRKPFVALFEQTPNFSPDGKLVVCGQRDGIVRVYHLDEIRDRLETIGLGWPKDSHVQDGEIPP
jgi:WD40 repeat protein